MTEEAISAFYVEFGRRVKARRAWSGMKGKDLARLVGLSPASISNIEAGRQRPYLDTVGKIAQSLDVDLVRLFPTAPFDASVTSPRRQPDVSVTP